MRICMFSTIAGNYAFDVSHLYDLVQPIPSLVSFDPEPEFDASAMADIQDWVNDSSENMILIYGANDPWTVADINIPASGSLIKIINPNTKHSTRINDLNLSDQQLIIDILNDWANK